MNYHKAIDRLFSIKPMNKKRGLDTIKRLLELVGSPEKRLKCIHVAGTNGKGSCVTKIAAALDHQGHKVGLYTSPHISSYCERIVVGKKMISKECVVRHLQRLFSLADQDQLSPTFFEFTTALAFCYFAEEVVDFAVLETGIGGRLDATNVCHPIFSVITSISLDHTELLGMTEEAIAEEKAGIIKPSVPCVIGPNVPYEVMKGRDAPVFVATGSFTNFDEENNLIAKRALELLGVRETSILHGLLAIPPCRFQIISHTPTKVILDVAHNPDGIKRLFERIDEPVTVLCGFCSDKDVAGCLDLITQKTDNLFFVAAKKERAICPKTLFEMAQKGAYFTDLAQGIEEVFRFAARSGQILVVCGTFYIMSPVRRFLGFEDRED